MVMMVKFSVSMRIMMNTWSECDMQSKSETQNRKVKFAEQSKQCGNMQVPISLVVQDLRNSRCRDVQCTSRCICADDDC